jgi:copper chaperone
MKISSGAILNREVIQMEKKTLNVTGMSCEHCVAAVKNALDALAGVADVNVSLKDGTVSFSYDPALAPLETIGAAIRDEGYDFSSK